MDCVERDAWSRFTFFGFKFQIFECWILNFEFFGTQIGGIGLILKISFTWLSPWAKSKANENSFIQRCYPKNFVSKLSDCEAEAAETHVWLDFALACEYVTIEDYEKLYKEYDMILGMLVKMIVEPEKWNL